MKFFFTGNTKKNSIPFELTLILNNRNKYDFLRSNILNEIYMNNGGPFELIDAMTKTPTLCTITLGVPIAAISVISDQKFRNLSRHHDVIFRSACWGHKRKKNWIPFEIFAFVALFSISWLYSHPFLNIGGFGRGLSAPSNRSGRCH